MRRLPLAILICVIAASNLSDAVASNPKTPEAENADWPVYGGQSAGDHYSQLAQINRQNVTQLKVAWTYDTAEKGVLQASPLEVGGVLFGYTPTQKVFALNAATGKLLWTFDSGIKGTQPARGLTWWTDGNEKRLFAGVMHYLYALDPATGKPIPGFGENGRIDLRKNLRGDYREQSIALTSPGIVYRDMIIVGGRDPETHPAPPGDIRAFDVHTGALRWSFHTIPHPGEFGYDTWPKNAWLDAGAANNWAGMSLDEKRGILYVPTGSAVDDFYGADRLGNDLFANTLLALDAQTGKRIWHFQGVHHDIWDRDFPSPPALLTLSHHGKRVDAVAQTTKQGYLYLFGRVTGAPLFPIVEEPATASTAPGEVAAATQPRPLKPVPFARQKLTEQMLTTRTPEAHQYALDKFRSFISAGQWVPLSVDKQTIVFPGFDGGAEWGGPAVDPASGVLYVNENEMAWVGGLVENKPARSMGAAIYFSQCSVCHGEKRQGSPPAFPSLIDIGKKLSDEQMTATIHSGAGRMPSFPNLEGKRLKALLDFLRTGKDTGEPAGPGDTLTRVHTGARGMPDEDTAGAASYAEHCAICHNDDLSGIQPGFPSLLGLDGRLDAAQITAIVRDGKGRMPAFPKFSSSEMNALLRYLGADDISANKRELEASAPQPLRYRFTGYNKFLDQDGYPAVSTPWGTLNAIDLNTGKYLWKIPFGEYPELAAAGMKDTGSENYGGPVVTAGGLLFIAATVYDRRIHAYDSSTGKLLWEATLPFAGLATPITYMVDGKQYLVIAAGGGKDPKWPAGGVYVAFALP